MINKKILVLLFSAILCNSLNSKVKLINNSDKMVTLKYTFQDGWGRKRVGEVSAEPRVGRTSNEDWATDKKLLFNLFSDGNKVASKEVPLFGYEGIGNKVVTVTRNVDTNQFVMDIKPWK